MFIRSLFEKTKRQLGLNETVSDQFVSVEDLLFQVDPVFQALYQQGIEVTTTPPSGASMVNKRQARFYNLVNIYSLAANLEGKMAEIGCWRGLSSYLLNKTVYHTSENYTGTDYWIIDSFEGLSESDHNDQMMEDFVPAEICPGGGINAGSFSASVDEVRRNLAEFPNINYLKGWVPDVLDQVPADLRWKFVHIDLDLYAPIKGAFEYFSKRMTPGGIIVFDDYGSLYWPGARKAVNEVRAGIGGSLVLLSTGQAFWQAPFN
jgi:O-methyltransferase